MVTGAGPVVALPGRRWSWGHGVEPRWLLVGDLGLEGSYGDDVPLALSAEIEGLFVDLPPRPRERFTLVGCAPGGALAEVLDRLPAEALGTDAAWLGEVVVTVPPPAPGAAPSWWGEDLGDVVVLGRRPSLTMPGTMDIELDGFVRVHDRTRAVPAPGEVAEFVLLGPGGQHYGRCREVTGVFRDEGAAPVPQVRLLGCRPEPALMTVLGAVGRSSNAGRRRRRIRAEVYSVAVDGSVTRVIDGVVSGTVSAGQPSPSGTGLFDVTVDSDPREPLPAGMLHIVEQWRTGPPTGTNTWAGYDRELRHRWAGVALAHRADGPDRPAGTTYDLDGRFVTDVEGFYCAIGEAINGPGGYFGWNLDALHDCLGGGYGARTPFRLVWHEGSVAREYLVAGYDRRRLGPAVTLDYLLEMLAEHQVRIDLR